MGSEEAGRWPELDPVVARLVRSSAGPPHLHDLGPDDGRLALSESQGYAMDDAARFGVAPVGPSGLVGFWTVRAPAGPAAPPVVVYLHGGRWMLGDAHTHARLIRDLAAASGAALVVPEYTRTPEARYPVAVEETSALLAWVVEHAEELGVDGRRVAVAGDCAGATIATALAVVTARRGGPRLRAQLLYYPFVDDRCDAASHRELGDDYLLTRREALWYWSQYVPDPTDRAAPSAVPARATTTDLASMPPSLVITAEADVLRDEGERYADRLRAAGVAASASRYAGTVHDFASLRPLEGIPATRAAVAEGGAFLSAALAVHD
ncbi:esterase [Actinomycetospora sp. NBRC 106375]|uniref:alpha/beta hydrolase n=1 Tax=Actinomycetospora sp. NBRC 106375 TaxID=3032207 RepID=UPI0024A02311|nr:alpha/beta hydrolase [Actinomycetospora sp. NBRC 106375]GLZ48378.1 esterase [Actinomycetospora sp. NBRC 106375]